MDLLDKVYEEYVLFREEDCYHSVLQCCEAEGWSVDPYDVYLMVSVQVSRLYSLIRKIIEENES